MHNPLFWTLALAATVLVGCGPMGFGKPSAEKPTLNNPSSEINDEKIKSLDFRINEKVMGQDDLIFQDGELLEFKTKWELNDELIPISAQPNPRVSGQPIKLFLAAFPVGTPESDWVKLQKHSRNLCVYVGEIPDGTKEFTATRTFGPPGEYDFRLYLCHFDDIYHEHDFFDYIANGTATILPVDLPPDK